MAQTKGDTNKTPVLEVLDVSFSMHDVAAAERYWSPRYVHSADIEPGREPMTGDALPAVQEVAGIGS